MTKKKKTSKWRQRLIAVDKFARGMKRGLEDAIGPSR